MERIRQGNGWNGFWWILAVICVLGIGIISTSCNWDVLRGCQESVSATLRNMGLLTGGVVAIILAVWRSRVAERQANTALRQSKTAEGGLLNERYQKGADMLGNKVISVRLGGIYALRRLAEQHPQEYHIQIMQLFCAFARHPTTDEASELHVEGDMYPRLREDVQAVMTAIGGRGCAGLCWETKEGFHLDLFGAKLARLRISSANLSGSNLWKTDFTGAILMSVDMSNSGAISAILTDANLGSACLKDTDLTDACLKNANLNGANLPDSILCGASLSHVRAQKARFTGANLTSSDLTHANLENADLAGANIRSADLSDATLLRTNLSGTIIGRVPHSGSSNTEVDSTRLTQIQLNQAEADSHNPPKIDPGTFDIETGKQLVWCGKSPKTSS